MKKGMFIFNEPLNNNRTVVKKNNNIKRSVSPKRDTFMKRRLLKIRRNSNFRSPIRRKSKKHITRNWMWNSKLRNTPKKSSTSLHNKGSPVFSPSRNK